jgi:hypothetical protein
VLKKQTYNCLFPVRGWKLINKKSDRFRYFQYPNLLLNLPLTGMETYKDDLEEMAVLEDFYSELPVRGLKLESKLERCVKSWMN